MASVAAMVSILSGAVLLAGCGGASGGGQSFVSTCESAGYTAGSCTCYLAYFQDQGTSAGDIGAIGDEMVNAKPGVPDDVRFNNAAVSCALSNQPTFAP